MESEEIVFLEEDSKTLPASKPSVSEAWQVMVVDDDPFVHQVTSYALQNFTFENKPIEIQSCTSAEQARQLFRSHPGFALVLLDVVMEDRRSGLELVHYLRNEFQDPKLQIIIRTGQPGDVSLEELVQKYDINDYKLKSELTREKLFASVTLSLRTYKVLLEQENLKSQLRDANLNLEHKVKLRTSELENSLDVNNMLLRALTHDLRNFFGSLILRCQETLSGGTPDFAFHFKRILDQTERMNAFFNRIVMWEGLIAGKVVPDVEPVPVVRLFEEAIELLANQSRRKNVELVVAMQVDPNTPVYVEPATFSVTVLGNILSNAIKFSSPGEQIRLEARERTPDIVELQVEDFGIGIPQALIEKLFSPESKTSRVGTNGEKGTGFGMPLIKRYLTSMGGDVEITSICKQSPDYQGTTGTKVKVLLKKANR